jgi:hypothetical protein
VQDALLRRGAWSTVRNRAWPCDGSSQPLYVVDGGLLNNDAAPKVGTADSSGGSINTTTCTALGQPLLDIPVVKTPRERGGALAVATVFATACRGNGVILITTAGRRSHAPTTAVRYVG